jgi:hypothetical protein
LKLDPQDCFETRVFARDVRRLRGKTAARELPRDQGVMPRELAQDRANRSRGHSGFWQIDMFEPTRLLQALDGILLIDAVRSYAPGFIPWVAAAE